MSPFLPPFPPLFPYFLLIFPISPHPKILWEGVMATKIPGGRGSDIIRTLCIPPKYDPWSWNRSKLSLVETGCKYLDLTCGEVCSTTFCLPAQLIQLSSNRNIILIGFSSHTLFSLRVNQVKPWLFDKMVFLPILYSKFL